MNVASSALSSLAVARLEPNGFSSASRMSGGSFMVLSTCTDFCVTDGGNAKYSTIGRPCSASSSRKLCIAAASVTRRPCR